MNLAIFDLQVTPIPTAKIWVIWLFGLENKFKIDFQDGGHGCHLGLLVKTIFTFIYKSLWYFLPSFESVGFSVQEKKFKIDFQVGGRGGHLGFTNKTILGFFDLQVASMLPTKFQVIWLFHSEEDI